MVDEDSPKIFMGVRIPHSLQIKHVYGCVTDVVYALD